jgi:Flp pilus assembly protein TadG
MKMRGRLVARALAALARRCDGNVLIEFALALPILTVMMVGTLDLGRFAIQKSAMLEGARQGAQYAAVVSSSDSTGINNTAQTATGLSGVTASNTIFCECTSGVQVSCSSTCSTGTLKTYVTVTTTKSFQSVLSSGTISFGGTASFTAPTSITASMTMIVPTGQ